MERSKSRAMSGAERAGGEKQVKGDSSQGCGVGLVERSKSRATSGAERAGGEKRAKGEDRSGVGQRREASQSPVKLNSKGD